MSKGIRFLGNEAVLFQKEFRYPTSHLLLHLKTLCTKAKSKYIKIAITVCASMFAAEIVV